MKLYIFLIVNIFFIVLFIQENAGCQKYLAPINIEVKKPKIKITELQNNIDIIVQEKIYEYFTDHQKYFNVLDRRDLSQIDIERKIFKDKTSRNFNSAAMLGTQVIIESSLKNFKEKIDSVCVITKTETGKVGKVVLFEEKKSNCSLFVMTYSFNLELSAIDVESGAVIETINLNISVQGKTGYNGGKKDTDSMRKDCLRRVHNCLYSVLRESSLFITKIYIPVLGLHKIDDKKGEAKELFVLGGLDNLIPYNLSLEIFQFEEEKIEGEILQRQVVIGSGKFESVSNANFVMDVSKGKKEVFESIKAKKPLYIKLGKNMINKSCESKF